jgi:hypothetical protein
MADRKKKSVLLTGACLACSLLLAACADQPQKREQELGELVGLVAGRYDTLLQVRTEAAQGGQRREALQLAIVPVQAPLIGDAVFYVVESVAGDPRRVTSQQLVLFEVAQGVPLLVETQLAFLEPARWRGGDRNPELFRSLLPQDVKPLTGCEITWHKVEGGFDGTTNPTRCRAASRASGETLNVALTLTLHGDELSITEQRRDGAGVIVEEEPTYRFRRRAE